MMNLIDLQNVWFVIELWRHCIGCDNSDGHQWKGLLIAHNCDVQGGLVDRRGVGGQGHWSDCSQDQTTWRWVLEGKSLRERGLNFDVKMSRRKQRLHQAESRTGWRRELAVPLAARTSCRRPQCRAAHPRSTRSRTAWLSTGERNIALARHRLARSTVGLGIKTSCASFTDSLGTRSIGSSHVILQPEQMCFVVNQLMESMADGDDRLCVCVRVCRYLLEGVGRLGQVLIWSGERGDMTKERRIASKLDDLLLLDCGRREDVEIFCRLIWKKLKGTRKRKKMNKRRQWHRSWSIR